MSLISDALKKARQEAARQDALRQGVPYAMGAADAPVRRAPWLSLLAGLGAGCLLAGVVFVFAYVAGLGPFHKTGAEAQVAQAPAPVVATTPQPSVVPPPVAEPVAPPVMSPAAPPSSPAVATPAPKPEPPRREPEPAPTPVQEPPVRRPVPAPEPAAPAPIPTSEAEPLVPAPAPVTPSPAPQPAAPAPAPSGGGGLEEGRVYPGEVPLPGGGTLKLNGIAYSPDHPIAVLGGRVIGPGESVQGFTVIEIMADRVKLQGHGATVFLSTK